MKKAMFICFLMIVSSLSGFSQSIVSISGPGSAYRGQTVYYSANNVSPNDTMVWTISSPTAAIIQSGQGTPVISVLLSNISGSQSYSFTVNLAVTTNGVVKTASFVTTSQYCGSCPIN